MEERGGGNVEGDDGHGEADDDLILHSTIAFNDLIVIPVERDTSHTATVLVLVLVGGVL